jgi:deazaflavin-dependent oxidoreductase (nitroreductase family)
MGIPDPVFKGLNAIHRSVFRISKGKVAGRGYGMPVLVLTTTGRKSGAPREVMLTSPLQEDGTIALVASRGGDDRHPDWYHNLCADPDVTVEIEGATRPMRARVLEGDERERRWAQIVAAHDNYAGYQRKTDRTIPVVLLEPR